MFSGGGLLADQIRLESGAARRKKAGGSPPLNKMKSRRNRIVIDLNQPPPPGWRPRGRRSGRAGRILAIVGIFLILVLIVAAAGIYFGWQHYKGQPAYTLALLIDAAQRGDTNQINGILDNDKIAENLVSEVRSRMTGSSILNSLAPSQLDQMTANLTPKLKDTLREVLPPEIQRVTEPAKGKPFILVALSIPYFATIQQNGANASVDLKFKDELIQLTMLQNGDAWRITSIKDDRLTDIIADAARNGATQRGQQFQDEVTRRLKDLQTPSQSPSP